MERREVIIRGVGKKKEEGEEAIGVEGRREEEEQRIEKMRGKDDKRRKGEEMRGVEVRREEKRE